METLQRTANRGSISTGYDIDNSLKLEADNTERIQRTYANITSAGTPTSTKIATISFWLKRTELQSSGDRLCFLADANFTWVGFSNDGIYVLGSTAGINLRSSGKFRDTSAWYHIVVAFDTTQSTASNRVKVYVNGEQWTEFGVSENYGAQNNDIDLYDLNTSHYLGWSDAQSQSGYYSEFYLIDGQQLAPTEFGEFDSDSGIWKPKAYGGTFGVQGYHLDFEDSSALGADVSGNGNNFTGLYNITSADQATDTPTNNFCTLNPLYKCADTTMTDGATNCDRTNNSNNTVRGTFVVTKGKWYWEVAVYRGTINANYPFMGMTGNFTTDPCVWLIGDSKTFIVSASGNVEDAGSYKGSGTAAAQDPSYSIYGFAVDIDNKTLLWYTNGTANNSGNTYSMATSIGNSDEGMTPFLFMFTGANQSFNFGGYSVVTPSSAASDANGYGTFEYAPPSGYYALCTKNLAEYG